MKTGVGSLGSVSLNRVLSREDRTVKIGGLLFFLSFFLFSSYRW